MDTKQSMSGSSPDPSVQEEVASSYAASHGRVTPENHVNIHQFYPELKATFNKKLSEGDGSRPESALTDVTNPEEEQDTAVTREDTETRSVRFQDEADKQVVVYDQPKDEPAEQDDQTSTAIPQSKEDDSVFSTTVDEAVLQAAKERQQARGLFTPENWSPEKENTVTMQEVINGRAHEHHKEAAEHFTSKQYERCISSISKAINLRPQETKYYVVRAEAFLKLCEFQSAILNYKKACVLEPDSYKYYSRLAFIYFFQGQCLFDQKLYPEALEAFSRAAEMRPEVIGYHTRSISCLAALQRHGECLALVNKRLESEHQNADLFVMRARLHELFRNTTLCYYDIKDALNLNPDHPEANKLMQKLEKKAKDLKAHALQLNAVGRHRDALQKISIAIETDPSVPDFHVLRGALHRRLTDFNAAIDDYLLALDKTDHNEEHTVYQEAQRQLLLTYNDFAVECFTKGYYEESVILLNKAIKGEKREKGLYLNRGDCFFKQGNLQYAMEDYQQALEIDPADDAIRGRISVVHNERGITDYVAKAYQEAESEFTMAIQYNPKVGQYYVSRAKARQMMENEPGARKDVLMALHIDPSNDEVFPIMTRLFPGKTVKDVLHSKAAAAVRTQLQNLVSVASPVKLAPIEAGGEATSSKKTVKFEDVPPPIAGSLWKPGACFPDLKACMQEQEFNYRIAREKKQVNTRVKDALHNRKSLRYGGARVKALPEAVPYKRKGAIGLKEEMALDATEVKLTGWRKFNMGIGLQGT